MSNTSQKRDNIAISNIKQFYALLKTVNEETYILIIQDL